MFPSVRESICASLLVLGIPPVAPDRSCGAVCVRTEVQEDALYGMFARAVNEECRLFVRAQQRRGILSWPGS